MTAKSKREERNVRQAYADFVSYLNNNEAAKAIDAYAGLKAALPAGKALADYFTSIELLVLKAYTAGVLAGERGLS